MESSGRNVTPDKLPAAEREPLFAACDGFLRRLVDILEPEWLVGVGAFAARQAALALEGRDLRVGQILHPSPANPRANRDWIGEVRRQLGDMGLCEG
jgi:single-strand selective monofunctional uracil DNA glycosylase